MSQITPSQILRDHLALSEEAKADRPRKLGLFILFISIALIVGSFVLLMGAKTNAIGVLLTATSIMTGLIFTMAMRFWERSLDARSDPDLLFDTARRTTIDDMRTLLLWTVFAGILSTAYLSALVIFIGTGTANEYGTAVAAGLITYQLLYVGRALLSLYSSSYTLRK